MKFTNINKRRSINNNYINLKVCVKFLLTFNKICKETAETTNIYGIRRFFLCELINLRRINAHLPLKTEYLEDKCLFIEGVKVNLKMEKGV